MDIKQQTKQIAPSVGILAVVTIAALCGALVFEEYLAYDESYRSFGPTVDLEEFNETAALRKELMAIEQELELLTSEVIEGSGFGLWNLEQEVSGIAEESLREFEL